MLSTCLWVFAYVILRFACCLPILLESVWRIGGRRFGELEVEDGKIDALMVIFGELEGIGLEN